MSKQVRHILVIRFSSMGDVAMVVPVLRAFSEQYPDVKIIVLTRSFFKPFFKTIHNVSVFSADLKGAHKGMLGLYKLARSLNKNTFFYAVADLHNVLRSKVLKKIIRAKHFGTLDKGRKEKKKLTSGKVFNPLKTTHQRYADVFALLGYPIDLTNPKFPDKFTLNKHTKDLIGSNPNPQIGIAPFAAFESKIYPLGLMAEVIEDLSKDYSVILFGGGNKEIKILNALEYKYENVISTAGKLSLDEELAVISNLDIMIAMDSGNAHMAAMLGVKVVTLWGVTHPYAGFSPFNQPKDYALVSNRTQFPLIPTSVYGNKYPENYCKAMASISPKTVVNKVKAII